MCMREQEGGRDKDAPSGERQRGAQQPLPPWTYARPLAQLSPVQSITYMQQQSCPKEVNREKNLLSSPRLEFGRRGHLQRRETELRPQAVRLLDGKRYLLLAGRRIIFFLHAGEKNSFCEIDYHHQ